MRGLVATAVAVDAFLAGPGLAVATASPSAKNIVLNKPATWVAKPTKKVVVVRPSTAMKPRPLKGTVDLNLGSSEQFETSLISDLSSTINAPTQPPTLPVAGYSQG